jgi:hypothetical protein
LTENTDLPVGLFCRTHLSNIVIASHRVARMRAR